MFGVKLRPASGPRTSGSSVSSFEGKIQSPKTTESETSVFVYGKNQAVSQNKELSAQGKEEKPLNGIIVRCAKPQSDANSQIQMSASTGVDGRINPRLFSGSGSETSDCNITQSPKSSENNNVKQVIHPPPVKDRCTSKQQETVAKGTCLRSGNENSSSSKLIRQTSVEKDLKPRLVRQPPAFKPPSPPVAKVRNAFEANKATIHSEMTEHFPDQNVSSENSAIRVDDFPKSEELKDVDKQTNDDVSEGAAKLEIKELNNNCVEETKSDKEQHTETEDSKSSPVQMRRTSNNPSNAFGKDSSPVQLRRGSNQSKASFASTQKNNAPSVEIVDGVDISHVVMRRSESTQSQRSVSDIRDLQTRRQSSSSEEEDAGDDSVFDEGPFKKIFMNFETENQNRDLPAELCLNAYNKLKTYFENKEKYFSLQRHKVSVGYPVQELKILLASSM